MLVIPEAFARATTTRAGERGAAWLSTLPGLAEELLDRWGCVPDGDITHGSVGIIVPARQGAGRAAVLKLSFPHPGNVHEPDAFAAWGGHGAVLLHERDDGRFAMLLERAQTSTLAAVEDRDEVAAVSGLTWWWTRRDTQATLLSTAARWSRPICARSSAGPDTTRPCTA